MQDHRSRERKMESNGFLAFAFRKSAKYEKYKRIIMYDAEVGEVFFSVVGLRVVGQGYFWNEEWLCLPQ